MKQFEIMWNNLMRSVTEYGPNILFAIGIMILFWIIAKFASGLVAAGINKTGLAQKANANNERGQDSFGRNLGKAVYWVIILIGLIQALTQLGMTQIVDPMNEMMREIFVYIPKIFGAALIFGLFMIVANVLRQAAKSVLIFADPMPAKFGLATEDVNISGITSTVLSGIITITGLIAALKVLAIDAISIPATQLLNDVMGTIPKILIAGIIMAVFVFIARFVSGLARKTLPGLGIDSAVSELGILKGADRGMTASGLIASGASFFIILLGSIQALEALEFAALTDALYIVMDMGAKIAFGTFIIFAGVFLARMITGLMASAGDGATDFAANLVKWVIIIFSVILGISRMGLDPTGGEFILDIAKYLVLAAAAAGALAFGLGGKDWAAAQLEKIRSSR